MTTVEVADAGLVVLEDSSNLEETKRMRRQLTIVTLIVLVAVVALLTWRLASRGNRFSRNETRPPVADLDQPVIDSPWQDDLKKLGWNRFRGPNGTGVSHDSEIPEVWSESENLAWKTTLPGPGGSSPILTDQFVFVTSYSGYAIQRRDPGDINELKRHLSCIDRKTGEILWTKTVAAKQPESPYRGNGLPEHGYATNSPVTDGTKVFAFFGKSGVHAFDFSGKRLWQADVGDSLNLKGWGSCSSLITFNDLVIVNAAEESASLIALDKATGKEIWRVESPRLRFAFTTPALVKVDEDRTDLVLPAIGEVWGLNPKTGSLVWYCEAPFEGNVSPAAIVQQNRVYCFGGYQGEGSLCIEAGGRGDVTKSHVQWTSDLTSYLTTPILHEGNLYWIDDNRIFYCQDAATGELIEKSRVSSKLGSGRVTYASHVLIGQQIFLQTRSNGVAVFPADPDFKLSHLNQWESDSSISNATPAVGDGQLFLRTDKFLYCVSSEKRMPENGGEALLTD